MSAVLIARDEEARIAGAVASVRPWVSDVLVVDGGSRDATAEVARLAGARVILIPWRGYRAQKQAATDLALHDWIFSLDADERVDRVLGARLRPAVRELSEAGRAGARVRRVNYLDGVPVRASGWGRDRRVRLFDRRRARWGGEDPHDRVIGVRRAPLLAGALLHDPARTTRDYVRGTVRHARTKGRSMARRRRPGAWAPVLHGAAHWLRKVGPGAAFLDGRRGWTIAWVGARGTARAYAIARRGGR